VRAVQYHANDDVRIVNMPEPALPEGGLLVEGDMCGVCGSDVMEWYLKPRAPIVPGHEPVGRIAEAAPGSGFSVGQRVFVHHHVPCMVCPRCRRGNYTLCAMFKSTRLAPGGMAQRFAVPRENTARDVLPLPDSLSDAAATLIEPIGCIIRGIDRSGLAAGDTVAILGAGINGILLAMLSRLRGARRIFVSDPIASRRDRAVRLGADAALDPGDGDVGEQIRARNDGALADVVFVTPSKPAAALAGLALVEPGGNLLLYAPCAPGETIPLQPHKVFFEEIRLTSTYSAGPHDTRLALDYLTTGRIPGDELVTHVFPLDRAQEAFHMAANPGEGLKAAIRLR